MAIDYNAPIEIRDQRNGEWYWIHKDVIERYGAKIGVIGLALYNAYCLFVNNKSGLAYPSVTKIAKMLNVSRMTIFKYNEVLAQNGLIKIKSGGGRKKVNEVYLLKIKVNDVTKTVNVVTETVNDVDTEQELLTRITNNARARARGFEKIKEKIHTLGLKRIYA